MNPSDEIERHDRVMRWRTLQADLECAQMRIEFVLIDFIEKITPLVHEVTVARQQWEIEQYDAWAIAQRDPEAWLDRLVTGTPLLPHLVPS